MVSLSPDPHVCPLRSVSSSKVNFVNFFHESDKLRFASTFNTLFSQHVQICMSNFRLTNVFQWNMEHFFFRPVESNSKFNVMTIDEVTLDRPKVLSGFSVMLFFVGRILYGSPTRFSCFRVVSRSSSSDNFAVPCVIGKLIFLRGNHFLRGVFEQGFRTRPFLQFLNDCDQNISPDSPVIFAHPRNMPLKKYCSIGGASTGPSQKRK